eukprot:gene21821-biopygen16205
MRHSQRGAHRARRRRSIRRRPPREQHRDHPGAPGCTARGSGGAPARRRRGSGAPLIGPLAAGSSRPRRPGRT